MERFSAGGALELIERERVTYIPTAPASIVAMLNSPDLKKRDLTSLRVVITGGASAAIETIKAFQAALPSAQSDRAVRHAGNRLSHLHAPHRRSAEGQRHDRPLRRRDGAAHHRRRGQRRAARRGRRDRGDRPVGAPRLSEQSDAANRDSFTADGWFRTGDLGQFVDAEGNVRIAGRKKEIINRGGKKYFPREIEEILYEHPAILHVAMVGTPDARLGERNCLCVVLKPGASLTLDEVVAFFAAASPTTSCRSSSRSWTSCR